MDEDQVKTISPQNIDFHPVLKDIENLFWLFLLSNRALAKIETQQALETSEFSAVLKKYNDWTVLKIERDLEDPSRYVTKLNVMKQMLLLSKTMALLTYDLVLSSEYNDTVNTSNEIQFLRFIRNGAAHHNKFNMKDQDGR